MKIKNNNALLVEIMIAVLCFGLATTVILQTFVAARNQSDQAALYTTVLLDAQNLADQVRVADEAALNALVSGAQHQAGSDGDCYIFECESGIPLVLTIQPEQRSAGVLRRATVTAAEKDKTLVSLACSAYIPDEGVGK